MRFQSRQLGNAPMRTWSLHGIVSGLRALIHPVFSLWFSIHIAVACDPAHSPASLGDATFEGPIQSPKRASNRASAEGGSVLGKGSETAAAAAGLGLIFPYQPRNCGPYDSIEVRSSDLLRWLYLILASRHFLAFSSRQTPGAASEMKFGANNGENR
jgi:hypothetical protein